ncbi:MAG TPA: hypothetical protein PKJ85_08990 [Nitrosomonas nitrosa]|nr:hypothetical protein [Nitrosomonas nitrosa]
MHVFHPLLTVLFIGALKSSVANIRKVQSHAYLRALSIADTAQDYIALIMTPFEIAHREMP